MVSPSWILLLLNLSPWSFRHSASGSHCFTEICPSIRAILSSMSKLILHFINLTSISLTPFWGGIKTDFSIAVLHWSKVVLLFIVLPLVNFKKQQSLQSFIFLASLWLSYTENMVIRYVCLYIPLWYFLPILFHCKCYHSCLCLSYP